MQINENGILSFRSRFSSTFIQLFGSLFTFQPLIAPLWSDLDLNVLPCDTIYYRTVRDDEALDRARNLTQEQFPGVNFELTDVIVVTWYQVGHRFLSSSESQVCYIWSL